MKNVKVADRQLKSLVPGDTLLLNVGTTVYAGPFGEDSETLAMPATNLTSSKCCFVFAMLRGGPSLHKTAIRVGFIYDNQMGWAWLSNIMYFGFIVG